MDAAGRRFWTGRAAPGCRWCTKARTWAARMLPWCYRCVWATATSLCTSPRSNHSWASSHTPHCSRSTALGLQHRRFAHETRKTATALTALPSLLTLTLTLYDLGLQSPWSWPTHTHAEIKIRGRRFSGNKRTVRRTRPNLIPSSLTRSV